MASKKPDLSVFKKFNFESPPVGIKYLYYKPDGIERLDKNLALCQMLREAQQRQTPFFADAANHACGAALYVLGEELPEIIEAGYLGPEYKVFKEARVNRRIYYSGVPRLHKNTVKYIAFSPLDQITSDPDLLIVLTDNASQTEILLRAMSYTTGKAWSSKMTNVLGCAWLYAYPYITGEVNYLVTGLGYGMKVRKVFPEDRQLISIPFDWLDTITQNLQEMMWVLPGYTDQYVQFYQQVFKKLGLPPPQLPQL